MKKVQIVLAAVIAMVAAVTGVGQLSAQSPPITITELTPRSVVTDDIALQLRVKHAEHHRGTNVVNFPDPSLVVTAEILVQPGAQFPWHQHAGPVIVTVAEGELVYVEAADCVHRSYPAGTVFVDPGNSTHSAFNPTSGTTRLIATFFGVAATGPLTLTQGVEPGDCVLLP
jgi:quercetin dioxygenase-like cupin family protein